MDPEWAARACEFYELCPHVEGEWDSPLIVLEDWQVFIIVNIWGWRKKENPKWRRFDTVYIEVARKNAKSMFAAVAAIIALVLEDELGAQVKCSGTTGDQARIVFDVARKIFEKQGTGPQMCEAFQVKPFTKTIICYENGGHIRPINAKASTQDGLNPHCSILDELHAHKTRDLFDVLKSARGARKNPLSLYITTAGYNVDGVCYEQRNLVTKFLQDKDFVADHYFGIIYTLDDDDDVFDETKWIKANPNLGVSVQLNDFRSYALEAKNSTATLAEFKTKRLNIWTSAKAAYINIIKWKACANANIRLEDELEKLRDLDAWAAFDLASVSDLTAFRIVWQLERLNKEGFGEKYVKTWGKFYLPEDALARPENAGVPYRLWADRGFITITPGDTTDYAYIEKDIEEANKRFRIKRIAYDPWNAHSTVKNLQNLDIPLVQFIQGTRSYNPPMREVERLYLSKLLEHEDNPALNYNASNLLPRRDVNSNLAPYRKGIGNKIDGFVALLMALGIMQDDLINETGVSIYEKRGIVSIQQ